MFYLRGQLLDRLLGTTFANSRFQERLALSEGECLFLSLELVFINLPVQINHFPGTFHLGRKDRLWLNIRRQMTKWREGDFAAVMPRTFVLPKDAKALKAFMRSTGQLVPIILKPVSSSFSFPLLYSQVFLACFCAWCWNPSRSPMGSSASERTDSGSVVTFITFSLSRTHQICFSFQIHRSAVSHFWEQIRFASLRLRHQF